MFHARIGWRESRRSILVAAVLALGSGCADSQPQIPATQRGESQQAAVMKIRLERTGGFANMTRTLEVDIDSLPENERSLVAGMIDDADFFALPSVVPRSEQRGADLYSYRITIESADGLHTVEATQLSIPESLEPLIFWLDRRPSSDSSDATSRP